MASPLQVPNTSGVPTVPPIDIENPEDASILPGPIPTISQAPVAAAPTTYTPEQLTVDPSSTVEGRVGSIISKGGVLQQLGQTRSAQQQQQKGLLNTSMAIGAAQKANIESALPIATSDAATAFAAQQANVAATNRSLESESLFGQQTALQDQKAVIDEKLLTASADEQMRLIAQRGDIDTQLQNLRGEQAIEQIGVQGTVEEGLIDRRGEIDKELQTADSVTRSKLLQEQGFIDLKMQAIDSRARLDQISAQGSIDSRLVSQRGAIDKQLLTAEGAIKEGLLAQQGAIDFELVKARGEAQSSLQAEAGLIGEQLAALNAEFRSDDLLNQRNHETDLTNMQGEINQDLARLQAEQDMSLQALRGAQAESLEAIRGEFDTLLATQQSATVLLANHIQTINEILANPDIPHQTKDSLIQYQIDALRYALGLIGSIDDVDFGDLLGEGTNATIDPITEPSGPLIEQNEPVIDQNEPQRDDTTDPGILGVAQPTIFKPGDVK